MLEVLHPVSTQSSFLIGHIEKPPLLAESRQHTRLHPPLLRVRQLLQATRQV